MSTKAETIDRRRVLRAAQKKRSIERERARHVVETAFRVSAASLIVREHVGSPSWLPTNLPDENRDNARLVVDFLATMFSRALLRVEDCEVLARMAEAIEPFNADDGGSFFDRF